MIKNKFVTIKQITHNFNYYKDLGYNVKKGKELIIKVNDLPHTSHIEIIGICDICGKEKIMQYRNYIDRINNSNFYVCSGCRFEKTKITNNLKYKVDNVFQLENIKEKTKETLLKNYGVDHPLKNERIKDKLRKTCFDRYGVENVFQFQKNIDIIQKKSKITRIKNGQQIPDDKLTEWDFYKKKVTSITRKNKKQLFQ